MPRRYVQALLTAIVFCASGVLAGAPGDPEATFRAFLADDGTDRVSGKGQYVRHIYRRKVTLAEVAPGVEFRSQKHREAFAALLRAESGIELGLDADQNEYSLENLWFDGASFRREVIALGTELQADQVLSDPRRAEELPVTTYVHDGTKTVALTQRRSPSGPDKVATINPETVWIPPFQAFGANDGGECTRSIEEALDRGTMGMVCSTEGGQLVVSCELEQLPVRAEFRLAPQMDGALLNAKMFMGDRLVTETICSDYFRCDSGNWSPGRYVTRKYADIAGQRTLTYSESYEAIPNAVDFNLPLERGLFQLKLPPGTHVMDLRHSEPLEFIVPGEGAPQLDASAVVTAAPAQGQQQELRAEPPGGGSGLPAEAPRPGSDSVAVRHRTWLQEWGWAVIVLVTVWSFMFWLLYKKRHAQGTGRGE